MASKDTELESDLELNAGTRPLPKGRPTRRKFILAGGVAGATLLAGCTTGGDLSVDNLEVTQAIQYIDNSSEPDNSLPLVRGKRAFVRAYVTGGSGNDVDGQLRVWVGGSEHSNSPFPSENGPISPPSSVDREVTDDTLNFQFLVPETGYGSGDVDVDFEVEVDNGLAETEENFAEDSMRIEDVTFRCHRSPSIAYIPIDYTYDDAAPGESGEPDSWKIQPGIGDDYMWHTYPIPEPPNYYEAPVSSFEWDEDVNTSYSSLFSDLETERTMMSPQPDYVYGWFAGNPYGGNGRAVGIGSGNVAFGNTEDSRYQRTFAHEIGHLMGLYHYDGQDSISPEVGFYSSYPVHNIRTDDCDSSGSERTKCGSLADFMDPGRHTDEAWIDPGTYTHLANHSLISDHDECPAVVFPEIPRREYYFVTGTIARNEEVGVDSLNPIYRLEGSEELTEDNPDGTRRIEFRDEGGEVVLARNFEVSFFAEDSEEPIDEATFALSVPVEGASEIESVVLLSEQEEVARIERSPNAPEVEIETPRPDDTLMGEEVPIRWGAFDEDGDDLQFSVQYSPDEGESFVPLTVNITETGFDLNTAEIPGSLDGAGIVRLIATDGFNTTVREVAGLTVGERKPPEVRITEPKPHGGVEEAQDEPLEIGRGTLVLSGHAYDMEDGFLTGEALEWRLNGERELGTGRTIQVDLTEGEHEISFHAVDSDGAEGRDSITVFVDE